MARVIVLADAERLDEGIKGEVLMAEEVSPAHLDDLSSSEKLLERLEWAIRGEPMGEFA